MIVGHSCTERRQLEQRIVVKALMIDDSNGHSFLTIVANISFFSPLKIIYCSLNVVDDRNISSEEVDIIIVLCTGCNGHGACNQTDYRPDSTNDFKYATCNCEAYWTGKSLILVN